MILSDRSGSSNMAKNDASCRVTRLRRNCVQLWQKGATLCCSQIELESKSNIADIVTSQHRILIADFSTFNLTALYLSTVDCNYNYEHSPP